MPRKRSGHFCLNTDYNLDTTTEAVQKAVHTVILIFASLLRGFLFIGVVAYTYCM